MWENNLIFLFVNEVINLEKNYDLGSLIVMKKGHPCGENLWEVVRLGADIRIKCTKCGRIVMIPRIEFNKKIKKIIEKES